MQTHLESTAPHKVDLSSPIYSCESESVSHPVMSDFATAWTVASQVPLPMGFTRQEYWSGVPFPTPGDLSDPGVELVSVESPVDSLIR